MVRNEAPSVCAGTRKSCRIAKRVLVMMMTPQRGIVADRNVFDGDTVSKGDDEDGKMKTAGRSCNTDQVRFQKNG